MSEYRLLVIEDDKSIAALVYQIAINAGFEAHTISEPRDITTLYRSLMPDVIVLDILMPEMDGFDVLNYLREHDCQAKIVLLSGSTSYRNMAAKMGSARGLSIVANLAKPFRAPALRMALEEIRESLSSDKSRLATTEEGAA